MRRNGAIMLELMVSLAIFVMAGLAIGGAVRQGLASMARSREENRAADLARSAMAMLEAGLETPLTLNGPVKPWLAQTDIWVGDGRADEERAATLGVDELDLQESGWELEVATEPSEFAGLTKVTVRAVRFDPENADIEMASATLVQLVALRADADDVAGEASGFGEAAAAGERENRRSEQRPVRGGRP